MSWFDDPNDRELLELLPYLEEIALSDDVYTPLRANGFTSQAQETTITIRLQQDHTPSLSGPGPIARALSRAYAETDR